MGLFLKRFDMNICDKYRHNAFVVGPEELGVVALEQVLPSANPLLDCLRIALWPMDWIFFVRSQNEGENERSLRYYHNRAVA